MGGRCGWISLDETVTASVWMGIVVAYHEINVVTESYTI